MANKIMKTLTIGENTYEVVDEQARADIESLKQNPVIETDDTLTQSGQAADAKVVGDTIKNIETQINDKQPKGEYVTETELNAKGYLTQHQDLSSYAKKATTLAGYGITDGATKEQIAQLSDEIADEKTIREQAIADVKAQIIQQTPLFANSIEECTDTSKVYVLPDGYIYAYTIGEPQEVFVDVLKDVGYSEHMRINSSGAIVGWTTTDADLTGYIAVKPGDIIRVKNMPIPSTYTSGVYWNQVGGYDSNKAFLKKTNIHIDNDYPDLYGLGVDVVEEDGNIVQFTVKESAFGSNVAYIVINAKDITDDSEVYVNSTIISSDGWHNTGHAFVPANYEDRIIDLEEKNTNLEEKAIDHEARLQVLEEYVSSDSDNGSHTNQILSSINSDGTPYNEGTGYKEGYRLNSSAAEVALADAVVSGFIPYNGEDVEVRVPNTHPSHNANYLQLYDSNFAVLKYAADGTTIDISHYQFNYWEEYNGIIREYDSDTGTQKMFVPKELIHSNAAYIRVSAYVTATLSSDTFDLALDESVDDKASDDSVVDTDSSVPSYWIPELDSKAETIQIAMEDAGRNKSAFLWYTDAHWQTNSKMSPTLLAYLCKNTPMNKINFGGDIVNDPSSFTHENIKYVYEWRKMISGLPNHHSVYGNHDVNHRSTDVSNIAYAFMLAPEESAEMVVGSDSCYYIDNPSEKTRYLYLSYLTNNHNEMVEQGKFVVNALKTVTEGWHIVAIGHRWFQYTSASAPTVGSVPNYEKEILKIFDEYNARGTHTESNYFTTQNFADCKGKIEFCIGGHIHVDYDFETDGGIPVIITASDTNQERSSDETEDSGTVGTVTESAVYGIIADYTNNKISVIGVGRGGSREITI